MKTHSRLSGARRSAGFTLIEVLAAMMLIAIVIPSVMKGITLATALANTARHRSDAASLAEGKLNEILATGLWQNQSNLSGDFSPQAPDYKWTATIQPWSGDTSSVSIQEIDLTVTWQMHGQQSLTLSTLSYIRTSTNSG